MGSDNANTEDQAPGVATYTFGAEDKYVDKRYANVKSDVIEITHDKLENVLLKFYQNHLLRFAWFNPLSLGIGLALTLTTADFKANALGVEGGSWKAIFILALCGSVIWLVISLVRLAARWNETSLEFLIDRIKNVQKGGITLGATERCAIKPRSAGDLHVERPLS